MVILTMQKSWNIAFNTSSISVNILSVNQSINHAAGDAPHVNLKK